MSKEENANVTGNQLVELNGRNAFDHWDFERRCNSSGCLFTQKEQTSPPSQDKNTGTTTTTTLMFPATMSTGDMVKDATLVLKIVRAADASRLQSGSQHQQPAVGPQVVPGGGLARAAAHDVRVIDSVVQAAILMRGRNQQAQQVTSALVRGHDGILGGMTSQVVQDSLLQVLQHPQVQKLPFMEVIASKLALIERARQAGLLLQHLQQAQGSNGGTWPQGATTTALQSKSLSPATVVSEPVQISRPSSPEADPDHELAASKSHNVARLDQNSHETKGDSGSAASDKTKSSGSRTVGLFPERLYRLLMDNPKDCSIGFSADGKSAVVHDVEGFARGVGQCYFQQSSYHSFRRQMRLYGFLRRTTTTGTEIFYHASFERGKPEQLSRIRRVKSILRQAKAEHVPGGFPVKLYHFLMELERQDEASIAGFDASGKSFKVSQPDQFLKVSGKYFRLRQFRSLQRQLCLYGFHRHDDDPTRYSHACFQRGRVELLARITKIDAAHMVEVDLY